ncbi:MAG: hypothetical protein HQK83_00950 [Fibrobacteria bacterium]|nr:hypothetical protein [Fibrobacteria bacterium]
MQKLIIAISFFLSSSFSEIVKDDFQVSGDLDSVAHTVPEIACAKNGNYVAAWLEPAGVDKYTIVGRLFNAEHIAISEEFVVNADYRKAYGSRFSLAISDSGLFVFAWYYNYGRGSGSDHYIFYRRYNKDGTPFDDGPLVAFDNNSDRVVLGDIDIANNGTCVVSWFAYNTTMGLQFGIISTAVSPTPIRKEVNKVGDDSKIGISENGRVAILFGGEDFTLKSAVYNHKVKGMPQIGASYTVDTLVNGKTWDMAMTASGNFVVSWEKEGNDCLGIRAQRFNADGVPVDQELNVDGCVSSSADKTPRVAIGFNEIFTISWEDVIEGNAYFRTYTPSGEPATNVLEINSLESDKINDIRPAVDQAGKIIFVWEDNTTSPSQIMVQKYYTAGTRIGVPIRVNGMGSSAAYPDVAYNKETGQSAVVWEDYNNGEIYLQTYDPENMQISTSVSVNTWDPAKNPSVALGESVFVVWLDKESTIPGIWLQRVSYEGVLIGNLIGLNSSGSDSCYDVSIAAGGDKVAVVWAGKDTNGDRKIRVKGKLLSSSGAVLKDSLSLGEGSAPSVAFDQNGQFIVTYHKLKTTYFNGRPINTTSNVYVRRYNASGTQIGNVITVNSEAGKASSPKAGMASDGNFAICWIDGRGGTLQFNVYGQLFSNNGTAIGSNFRIDTSTTPKSYLDIDMNETGTIGVSWFESVNNRVAARIINTNGTPNGPVRYPLNKELITPLAGAKIALVGANFFTVWMNAYNTDINQRDIWGEIYGFHDSSNPVNTEKKIFQVRLVEFSLCIQKNRRPHEIKFITSLPSRNLEILDMQGRVKTRLQSSAINPDGKTSFIWNTSMYAKGTYLARTCNAETCLRAIVINK